MFISSILYVHIWIIRMKIMKEKKTTPHRIRTVVNDLLRRKKTLVYCLHIRSPYGLPCGIGCCPETISKAWYFSQWRNQGRQMPIEILLFRVVDFFFFHLNSTCTLCLFFLWRIKKRIASSVFTYASLFSSPRPCLCVAERSYCRSTMK